jgi:ribonuclease R
MANKHPSHGAKRKKRSPLKNTAAHSPHIPETCVLVIRSISKDGELLGEPLKWDARKKPPHIVVTESGRSRAAAVGDKVLAKLRKLKPHLYHALVIKILPGDEPRAVLGVFVATADGGIVEPVSRKMKESFMVAHGDTNGALHGELVSGITLPGMPSLGMTFAKINERLGRLDSPKAASLIAANMHDLPQVFSAEVLAEAEAALPPVMSPGRADLRNIPLVTIDGEDARDFDDAVFAAPDDDPKNKGGFHLMVAIADVAYYVPEGGALDASAFERGNSVYFPDRVIPMLPERLSNGLCSLAPNEDRYCLAVHIWINSAGEMKRYEFVRGLMRSVARLTYEGVEGYRFQDTGHRKEDISSVTRNPLSVTLVANLYAAYALLALERDRRGALDLNLPEYKILFDAVGNVEAIAPRARLEAHRLIEAFMIAANVAAADFLLKKHAPAIYRVHEPPAEEKLEDLRQFLGLSGYGLAKGSVTASHMNRVLKASEGKPEMPIIHTAVLRSQMQAYYSHENLGHFGLSLQKYCHFTSPIRRYSDLVVHRALVNQMSESKHKHHPTSDTRHLTSVALHISETERKAMMAERDAADRYKVSFMSRHIGNVFAGTINSLNEYGLFVMLAGNGVTGFVPVRNLGGDFFHYDKRHACFKGARSKHIFRIGDPIFVRVAEANAMTGSLIFEIEREVQEPPPLRPLTSKKQFRKEREARQKSRRRH